MHKRHALTMLGGISVVGLGIAGLSWGQGRLRYLAAETRPTVTPLPAVAGQPQRFIMTFDNGWTVNEIRRDGTALETDYKVYPDLQEIRPSGEEDTAPVRRGATPPRDDAAPVDPNDRDSRDNGADDGTNNRDNGADNGADAGTDNGTDAGRDNLRGSGRALPLRAK